MLGDGIRRSIGSVSKGEDDRLRDALMSPVIDEGWTYGVRRDDGNKQHPDLAP